MADLSSAAAALALVWIAIAPGQTIEPQPPAVGLLVATGETGLRLDVTYILASEIKLVAAIGLTRDGLHDHELWLVPAKGGTPRSLGVVTPGELCGMTVPQALADQFGDGAGLVLTR